MKSSLLSLQHQYDEEIISCQLEKNIFPVAPQKTLANSKEMVAFVWKGKRKMINFASEI